MTEKQSITGALLSSDTAQRAAHALGVDPRPSQRMSIFNGQNEGPASVAARITGVRQSQSKDDSPYITNNEGIPIPNTSSSLHIGGYPVSSDIHLMEHQQTFNRSKTLERMVHPCGSGAFGYFETTTDLASKWTKAAFLQGKGKKTPVFTRFSTVTFGREFPDSGRNPRGFATKFYTEEGNYDLVGLNFPVFFVRDPMLGPDVIRSQQRNPANFLLDYDSLFDFLANVPESMHAGTMFFSDHGTPVGWRFMDGFGCHTFKWVNDKKEQFYVKYHLISENGKKQFTWPQAVQMSGEDPDFAKRDLWDCIEKGGEASWKMFVQVMPIAEVAQCPYDPFDVTKVWYRSNYPMHEIGRLVLNKNPENYHRDVEQSAFHPGSLVPGIEPSPDMLLNWRMWFYRDAQYHRLGVNLHQVPVNCPFMAKYFSPSSRDGPMRTDSNGDHNAHYTPHGYKSSPMAKPDAEWQPAQVYGPAVLSRNTPHIHEGTVSEYDQARELYTRVMTEDARKRLWSNIAGVLKLADPLIQHRFLAQCYAVHHSYAEGVYALLPTPKFTLDEVATASKGAHLVKVQAMGGSKAV